MIHRSSVYLRDKRYPFFFCVFIALLTLAVLVITDVLTIRGAKLLKVAAQEINMGLVQPVYQSYLPIIIVDVYVSSRPKVNIPYIRSDGGEFLPEEAAVFWFGKVTPEENYTDVRVGYDPSNMWVRLAVIDRRLWYDPSPTPEDLSNWDAVSLFLVDGNDKNITSDNTYRFDAQLNWWGARDQYQASYQKINGDWQLVSIPFLTDSLWWGFPAPNDDLDDRAWAVAFKIPFHSLGFDASPPEGTEWRIGLMVHDRDDLPGTPIPDKAWPGDILTDYPVTWGIAHFGLPGYTPPRAADIQTFTLQNGLNGIIVTDGMVGGGTLCGEGLDLWSQWGDHSYPEARDINVQNQGNTDDWPCFSKIYITFPLESIPLGMEVISATLTLHQSGNSTGFPDDPPKALNSLIQVWQITQDWDPAKLSWNNAPQPVENLSQAWVGSIDMPELGIARTWDVSQAATRAYAAGAPLRVVLYSADFYGPHGKYFFSSTSTDYGGEWRPSLEITLGIP